jgi:hypothetical protein
LCEFLLAVFACTNTRTQRSVSSLPLRHPPTPTLPLYYYYKCAQLIAIISDAASTGISLQADRRAANQRRRVHITLELPWSADKAVQQFGRSHRSNQTSAPVYKLVRFLIGCCVCVHPLLKHAAMPLSGVSSQHTPPPRPQPPKTLPKHPKTLQNPSKIKPKTQQLVSQVGGEWRFAGAVAKRLASLGALLKGDRRAVGAGESLKEFDVENKWGRDALSQLFDEALGFTGPMPGVEAPDGDDAGGGAGDEHARHARWMEVLRKTLLKVDLLSEGGLSGSDVAWSSRHHVGCKVSAKTNVARFLNRLLGLSVPEQAAVFGYFSRVLDATVAAAKSRGAFDAGIRSLGNARQLTVTDERTLHTDAATGAPCFCVFCLLL